VAAATPLPTVWHRAFSLTNVYQNAATRFTTSATQPHVTMLALLACLRTAPAHKTSVPLINHCRARLIARSTACEAEWRRAVAQFGGDDDVGESDDY
jgi:hypothetical protein